MTTDPTLTEALDGAAPTGRHVAIYLRVSTDEQDVDHQRTDCYATAERVFPHVPTVEYVDRGVSASKHDMIDRERARAMIDAIERGEVEGVVTWKQDRLSRRGGVEISMFLERCRSGNVRVLSATEAELGLDDMGSEMMSSNLAILAKWESRNKGDRSRSGQLALARQGKWPKGPTPPGYDRDPQTKALVENGSGFLVRQAFERFDRGESRNSLAAWLTDTTGETFARHRVRDMLGNRVYIGRIIHGGKEHEGLHDPLVSEELFARVQDRLAEWKGFDMRLNRRSPYGAMFRCHCGDQLHHHSETRRGLDLHNYECLTCKLKVHAEEVDLWFAYLMCGVTDWIKERLPDPDWRSDADPERENALRAELADLTDERKRLLTIAATGDDLAKQMAAEKHVRSEQLTRSLRRLELSWASKRELLSAVVETWQGFHWQLATVEERHQAVLASVEAIRVERVQPDCLLLCVQPRGVYHDHLAHPLIQAPHRTGVHRKVREVGFGVPSPS